MSHDHDPQQPPRPAYPPQAPRPSQGHRPSQGPSGLQESHAPQLQQPHRVPHPRRQPNRVPHPEQSANSMYAPGVPRVNGRYDLGELDQQREEMNIRSGDFDRINWPKQLIWVIGFSLVMAVVAIIVVWLTRLGLVSSNSGERIESTAAAPLALFMLLTAAWMLPFADTDLVADNLSPRWLPATGYVCLISIIHAAVLTLTSMLWPLIVGGAGFGSRIQDWPITPTRLGLIFLICWAVGLSSTGSLMSLQRLMFTRLWMLFAVGIPWALLTVGGVIVLAYVLVNSAPANYGAVTVVVAVALLVAHILVPTVLLASQPRRR